MSEPVIRVEGIGKEYRIGQRERYVALRDRLSLKNIFGRLARREPPKSFWAVRDVSFDVTAGDVIGLIGRNGSGKTTLLKLLSRITKPSAGRAEMVGRVGSLLEVGAGMHPELTGRENVFLNGAILGMSRGEIRRKFDEIVAFSEVDKFLDTPLKRYSSGMRVRLAFAVAAHLEPEILFVDEVLAVGDLAFQKKCLGRMGEIAAGGRTIIFVSHQMNQIRRLCTRAIWLDKGAIRASGPTAEIVGTYEGAMTAMLAEPQRDTTTDKASFVGWNLIDPPSGQPHVLSDQGELAVRFLVRVAQRVRIRRHGIALFDSDSRLMWGTAADAFVLEPGEHEFVYTLPTLPLKPGSYFWRTSLYDDVGMVDVYDALPAMLVSTDPVTHPSDEWAGFLNIPYRFERRPLTRD